MTDESGATGVDNVPITVGNTRPEVTIEIPENGQLAAFGDIVPYEITVTDAEDGTTEDGGIDCADVTLNISLGHDEHAHELDEKQGCSGTFETLSASGHGEEANVFPVIEAVYTDQGATGTGALTGRDEAILQPKRKQAEFFSSTGRVPGAPAGGDPGVQTETTADPEGGGLNIGFIEDGDYVSYAPFNLEGIRALSFRVASGGVGGTIQLRLDAPDGPLVAETAPIAPTGGWQVWTDVELALAEPARGHARAVRRLPRRRRRPDEPQLHRLRRQGRRDQRGARGHGRRGPGYRNRSARRHTSTERPRTSTASPATRSPTSGTSACPARPTTPRRSSTRPTPTSAPGTTRRRSRSPTRPASMAAHRSTCR